MDDRELPAPVDPADETRPTNKNVVRLRDYLGGPAGLSTVLKRRRVLAVDPKSLIGAPELRPRAHYIDTFNGVTETAGLPAVISKASPLLPDRRDQIVRWIIARAKEPSSWRGLIALAAVAGWSLSAEDGEIIIAFGMGLAGIVGMLFPDTQGDA